MQWRRKLGEPVEVFKWRGEESPNCPGVVLASRFGVGEVRIGVECTRVYPGDWLILRNRGVIDVVGDTTFSREYEEVLAGLSLSEKLRRYGSLGVADVDFLKDHMRDRFSESEIREIFNSYLT